MNRPHRGKIAQLPPAILEQLNRRLRNGEQGANLVKWLNSLPEVRAVINSDFAGVPVREQNLSEWRTGGFREWLVQSEALEAVTRILGNVIELHPLSIGLTDHVALWLTTRYLVAAQAVLDKEGAIDWKMLREFCHDLVALRRGDHSRSRVTVEESRQRYREIYIGERIKSGAMRGLDALFAGVRNNKKAAAAYIELCKYLQDPDDKAFKPDPPPPPAGGDPEDDLNDDDPQHDTKVRPAAGPRFHRDNSPDHPASAEKTQSGP
jgi:hypothetical protein